MTDSRKKTLKLLRQAKGMLDKVIAMAGQGDYCMNIIQQSLAVQGFLKAADLVILENHLNTCFKSGIESMQKKTQQKHIKEILRLISKVKH